METRYVLLILTVLLACASSSGSALNPMNPIAERSQSHVDFVPTTAKPEPAMPPDLKQETYDSVDDIQTATLPRSQITVVLSSYDKTIGETTYSKLHWLKLYQNFYRLLQILIFYIYFYLK